MRSSTWHHCVGPLLLSMATACGGRNATEVDPPRIDIIPPSTTIRVGESSRLVASVIDSDGGPMSGVVEWQTDDAQIAKVDADGSVTGVTVGSTSIRARSKGAVRTAPVTVIPELRLTVSAPEIEFTAVENGDLPSAQTITVATNEGTDPEGLTASVTHAAGTPDGWLAATVQSDGASVSLVVDHNGLPVGTYEAALTLTSTDARQPLTVEVRLLVVEPQPAIALGATRVSFSAPQGGGDPPEETISIANGGGGVLGGLSASVSYADREPAGWLTASVDETAPGTLTLRARVGTLPAGIYTAHVAIAADAAQNSPQDVTVTFSVGAPIPLITLDRAALGFALRRGVDDPPAQTVGISNSGAGTLADLAVSTSYSAGQPGGWVTTRLSATTAPATLRIGIAADSLDAVGTWTATVRVSSVHAPNSPQSIIVTVQVDEPPVVIEPPAAPSGLTATAVMATRIDLAWDDNSSDETAFLIERSIDRVVWSSIFATAPNVTSYTDAIVRADSTYHYRVAACRESLCSAPSALASATTVDVPPAAPRLFSASVLSSSAINLTWNAAEGVVQQYRLERRTGTAGTFVQVAVLDAAARAYHDGSLTPSTSYGYRIRACNSFGCSPPTAEVTVSTLPP